MNSTHCVPLPINWPSCRWRLHYRTKRFCQRLFEAVELNFCRPSRHGWVCCYTGGIRRRISLARFESKVGPQWHILAASAAWVLPGLGHFILGERRRATILAASIGLLWLSGLMVGGVSVCDHRTRPWWFVGQVLLAPSLAVNYAHRQLRQRQASDLPTHYEPSYGHMSEQGILFTALAGLLNLLAVMDVAYRDPDDPRVGGERPAGTSVTGDSGRQ